MTDEAKPIATDLTTMVVPLKKLDENSWNPNKQKARVFEAELESIRAFGFIDPITVRKKKGGRFEIIDGAHRFRAMKELDPAADVPVIVIDVDTPTAKRLTVILNETRGNADNIELGALLKSLSEEVDDLGVGMPYTQDELDALMSLGEFDFGQFGEPGADPHEDEGWVTLPMRVPETVAAMFEDAKERLTADGIVAHSDVKITNGQILEALVASYFAS